MTPSEASRYSFKRLELNGKVPRLISRLIPRLLGGIYIHLGTWAWTQATSIQMRYDPHCIFTIIIQAYPEVNLGRC